MPVFDEAGTVDAILEQTLAQGCVKEIVIVDDGSRDGSAEMLDDWSEREPKIKLIRHEVNQGKGAAIITARERVTGLFVVIQDADLEYCPGDYLKLLEPLREGRADAVYGTRFHGQSDSEAPLRLHFIGNRFLTWLTNRVTGLALTDMATCYKAMSSDGLKSLALSEKGFAIDPEITLRLAEADLRILEVPVRYRGRPRKEGKKIRARDGLTHIRCLLRGWAPGREKDE